MFMQDIYWRNKLIRRSNKRRRKTSLTKYLPLTLLQAFEKVVWGFTVRGSWRSNITAIFWPPNLWPSTLCLLVLLMLNRSPRVHSAGCWLSLLHLISIFSEPQFVRASRGPLRPGVAFLTTSSLQLAGTLLAVELNWNRNSTPLARRTQLSYIIVRRPLDLWNRMFNRHQAEIAVMQFRGHSLPVRHSVVAQWDLHLVPYYQP